MAAEKLFILCEGLLADVVDACSLKRQARGRGLGQDCLLGKNRGRDEVRLRVDHAGGHVQHVVHVAESVSHSCQPLVDRFVLAAHADPLFHVASFGKQRLGIAHVRKKLGFSRQDEVQRTEGFFRVQSRGSAKKRPFCRLELTVGCGRICEARELVLKAQSEPEGFDMVVTCRAKANNLVGTVRGEVLDQFQDRTSQRTAFGISVLGGGFGIKRGVDSQQQDCSSACVFLNTTRLGVGDGDKGCGQGGMSGHESPLVMEEAPRPFPVQWRRWRCAPTDGIPQT